MATVIKVGGKTISIDNKSNALPKATESAVVKPVFLDEMEECAKAAEAYALADIACRAVGNAIKSSEGFADAAKGVGKTIAGALKKALDAVIQFFIRIGRYIEAFASSSKIKLNCKAMLFKLSNGYVYVADDFTVPVGKRFIEAIKKSNEIVKQLDGNTATETLKRDAEAVMSAIDDEGKCRLNELLHVLSGTGDAKSFLQMYAGNRAKNLFELKKKANAGLKEAEAKAKSQNCTQEELNAIRAKAKAINAATRIQIKGINLCIKGINEALKAQVAATKPAK